MEVKISLLVLVLCLASSPIVQAIDDDVRNLLEAQFLNLTQDINIGAKSLKINPDEIDIVRVCIFHKPFLKLSLI